MNNCVKWLLVCAVSTSLVVGVAGCSSVGAKVVKHEVKKALPGVDTKGEKLSKKADRLGGGDEEKSGLLDRGPGN